MSNIAKVHLTFSQKNIILAGFYLLRNWIWILLSIIVGGLIGCYRFSKIIPNYTATINFVLSSDQKNNGLSGLAAQLGFDGTTANADNIFSGDNIIDLFKSRMLITSALMSVVDTPSNKTLINIIANKHFYNLYKSVGPLGTNVSKFNVAQKKLYKKIMVLVDKSFVVFKKDKKLVFYLISATDSDPDVAYLIAKFMLKQTSNFFISTKTKISAASVILLRNEQDSLGRVLGNFYNSSASVVDKTFNLNPSVSIQRSSVQINQSKALALSSAYAEVMRNLEIAKINLQKETPLYRIIDEPELPLMPILPSKITYVTISCLLGFLIMAVLIIINFFYESFQAIDGYTK